MTKQFEVALRRMIENKHGSDFTLFLKHRSAFIDYLRASIERYEIGERVFIYSMLPVWTGGEGLGFLCERYLAEQEKDRRCLAPYIRVLVTTPNLREMVRTVLGKEDAKVFSNELKL